MIGAPIVNFRDVNWYDLAPPWLRTDNGEKYGYVLQSATDFLLEKATQAILFRLPGHGDPSQLPYLSYDRQLVQGPAETGAQFVTELQQAIPDWARAGSRVAILKRIQAFVQNLQPGVQANFPELAIVSTTPAQSAGFVYPAMATWDAIRQGDPLGQVPAHTLISPSNFNWDGRDLPWRAWLILYMAPVNTALFGSAAATGAALPSACFTEPGQVGSAVDEVTGITYPACWIPATSGTPVNSPWLTITGLSGLTSSVVGQWLSLGGSAHASNNGTFPIVTLLSATSCVIANPAGVALDAGPLGWGIAGYPFIAPAPVWGAPDVILSASEIPAIDYGQNIGGVWQPAPSVGVGAPTCWGVSVAPGILASIRALLRQHKSAKSYYKHIVIAFDGGDGTSGFAYSSVSAEGHGNPAGQFASDGSTVGGVWGPVAAQNLGSAFDAYCDGTGIYRNCSVQNET